MLTWTQEHSGSTGQQVNLFINLGCAEVYSGDLFISCPNPCTFLLSNEPSGDLVIGYSYCIEEGQEDHVIVISLIDTSGVAIKGVEVSTA